MSKKSSKLLAEPQPVFVGGCLTLVMLLMQFYVITFSSTGKLVPLFNLPWTLISAMFAGSDTIMSAVWAMQTATPVLMLLFALIFGKKHASLLIIPSAIPAIMGLLSLLALSFVPYHVTYIIYIISVLFYILTAVEIIKTPKPFLIYACLISFGVCLITVLGLPPFVLFDKTIYISDLVYFLAFHGAIANFARAVPIQKNKNI